MKLSYPTVSVGRSDVVLQQLERSLTEMSELVETLKMKVTVEFHYTQEQAKFLTLSPSNYTRTEKSFDNHRVELYRLEGRSLIEANKEFQQAALEDSLGPLLRSHQSFARKVDLLRQEENELNLNLLRLEDEYIRCRSQLSPSSSVQTQPSDVAIPTDAEVDWIEALKSQLLHINLDPNGAATTLEASIPLSQHTLKEKSIDAWNKLVDSARRATIKHQLMLTRAQELQESISEAILTSLKKFSIAECSYLASRQFEAQKLYKELESQTSLDEALRLLQRRRDENKNANDVSNDATDDKLLWSEVFPFLQAPNSLPPPPKDTDDGNNDDSPSEVLTTQELFNDMRVRVLRAVDIEYFGEEVKKPQRRDESLQIASAKELLKRLYEMSYDLNALYNTLETTSETGFSGCEKDVESDDKDEDEGESDKSICPSEDCLSDDDDDNDEDDVQQDEFTKANLNSVETNLNISSEGDGDDDDDNHDDGRSYTQRQQRQAPDVDLVKFGLLENEHENDDDEEDLMKKRRLF